MSRLSPGADAATAMATTFRYSTQAVIDDDTAEPRDRQDAKPETPIMDDQKMSQLQSLRERLQRSEYEVDTSAVAAAILARLLMGEQPNAN